MPLTRLSPPCCHRSTSAGSRRSMAAAPALFATLDAPTPAALPAPRRQWASFKTVTVHIDYHVEIEGHRHSVSHSLVPHTGFADDYSLRQGMLSVGMAPCTAGIGLASKHEGKSASKEVGDELRRMTTLVASLSDERRRLTEPARVLPIFQCSGAAIWSMIRMTRH